MKALYFILILSLLFTISCKKEGGKKSISYDKKDAKVLPYNLAPSILEIPSSDFNIKNDSFLGSEYFSYYYGYPLVAILGEKAELKVKIIISNSYTFRISDHQRKGWFDSGYDNNDSIITLIASSNATNYIQALFHKTYDDCCTNKVILEIYENGDKLKKTINLVW